jgi:hypothetical protein
MSQSYDLKKTLVRDLHSELSSQDIINLHDNILKDLKWNEDVITIKEIELIKDSLNIQENFNKKIEDDLKTYYKKYYESI